MIMGTLKRAIALSFLYIGVILLILLLQFSGKGGQSERIGAIGLQYAYAQTGQAAQEKPGAKAEKALRSVELAFAGLRLRFDAKTPLRYVDSGGKEKEAALEAFVKVEGGLDIRFAGGIVLVLRQVQSSTQERISLSFSDPAGLAASLVLPYSLYGKASLEGSGADVRLVLSDGSRYRIQAPAKALDATASVLRLGAKAVSLSRVAVDAEKPQTQVLDQAPMAPAEYAAGVSSFLDKAWRGLSATRLVQGPVAWKDSSGKPRFAEESLMAYLAEAVRRGVYGESFARVKAAREESPGLLGYASAPFLGSLLPKMRAMEETDLVAIKAIETLVRDKSPEIFERERLLHFLVDRSPYSLAQEVFSFARSLESSALTPRQALGYLESIVSSAEFLSDAENPFLDRGDMVEKVLQCIRKAGKGFFFESEGRLSVYESLLAGRDLMAYGKREGKEIFVGIGQSLVISALALADDEGFLPEYLGLDGEAIVGKEGSLDPEGIYRLVADNPYYPREVSFAKGIAPGVWAWTSAKNPQIASADGRWTISLDFPEGLSHYLAVYGVKPFAGIKIYDLDYRADPDFESYDASGYLYRKQSGGLYLKMKHKKRVETVILSY